MDNYEQTDFSNENIETEQPEAPAAEPQVEPETVVETAYRGAGTGRKE